MGDAVGGLAYSRGGLSGTTTLIHSHTPLVQALQAGCRAAVLALLEFTVESRGRPRSDSTSRTHFLCWCCSTLLSSLNHPAQQRQPHVSLRDTGQTHREVRQLCQGHTGARFEAGHPDRSAHRPQHALRRASREYDRKGRDWCGEDCLEGVTLKKEKAREKSPLAMTSSDL